LTAYKNKIAAHDVLIHRARRTALAGRFLRWYNSGKGRCAMILSADQLKAIQHGEAVPVTVEKAECVVIRKDVYDKVKELVYDDSEVDICEAYPLMDAVARQEGWDDASEDLYDDLVPGKP